MAPVALGSARQTPPSYPALKAANGGEHVSTSSSSNALPATSALTLDFSQWTGPEASAESRQSFVGQLREACAGFGFFYLQNTPLDQGDLRKRIFDLNQAFFTLPLEVRQQISIVQSPHFRYVR